MGRRYFVKTFGKELIKLFAVGNFPAAFLFCSGRRKPAVIPQSYGDQLMLVMVHPQRGPSEPVPERQVVPQWEQVLAEAVLTGATLPQA